MLVGHAASRSNSQKRTHSDTVMGRFVFAILWTGEMVPDRFLLTGESFPTELSHTRDIKSESRVQSQSCWSCIESLRRAIRSLEGSRIWSAEKVISSGILHEWVCSHEANKYVVH